MNANEKRSRMLGEEKIPKVLLKLAIPGIIAMLISAVYNFVDTLFVGMLGNTSAMGAVSIVFPMFMLIAAFGQMFGVGAGSYVSRLLGEKNKKLADETTSTTFFTSLFLGIAFTVTALIFIEPLLKFFGSTETILPYAKEYAIILLSGSVFTILNMTLNNIIRAEGNAKLSMVAISTGAILNIVLDPILMFGLDMGVKGAALATVLSQAVSTILLVQYFLTNNSYVKISIKLFKFSRKLYFEIMKIGSATFARQAISSLAFALMNQAANPYGDAAVAGIGITIKVFVIGVFTIFGYNQGFQPVAGYNYGAKKYDRLSEAIKVSLKHTTIFAIITTIIFMLFGSNIVTLFTNDKEVIEIGSNALKAMSLLFPLFGFQQVYAVLFQSIGKGKESFILSISRQGLFFIPTLLILPKIFGLDGVIYSQTVADAFTIIVTAFLAIKIRKELAPSKENKAKKVITQSDEMIYDNL